MQAEFLTRLWYWKATGYTTLKNAEEKKPLPPTIPIPYSSTQLKFWYCKTAFKKKKVHNNSAFEESFKCHKPEQEGFRPYKNVGLALRVIFEELNFQHLQESQIHNPNPSTHLKHTMMTSSKKTCYRTLRKSILWALWTSLRSCYPAGYRLEVLRRAWVWPTRFALGSGAVKSRERLINAPPFSPPLIPTKHMEHDSKR